MPQQSFNILQDNFSDLNLVLNAVKTKLMVFSRSRTVDKNDVLIISKNGVTIERVSSYKYLGVWIDDKMTFNYHIDDLVGRLRQK